MSRGVSPADVVQALLDDPVFRFEDAGKYLRKGQCPGCGKRTLYVLKDKPWVIRCERLNKCGHEVTAREALPDVFADFARRYPPTEENRQATADAYLALDRGFDLSRIQGCYEQAAWPVPGTTDYIPTVRFYLDEGRTRWWERLIDRSKKDGQKANFGGRKKDDGSLFSGDAWTPPGMALEDGDRCFIVEGIFHAIALHHAGYKAIAAFSCSHFPSTFIEANAKRRIRWVVALDSDKAGREWARKHHARLKQMGELASVCLLPDGKDWDDLWRAGRIDARFITDRLYYGRLFMAETVQEKAYVYYRRHRRGLFLLDFENAIYSITLGKDFDKALGEAAVQWSEQELEAKRTGAVPATPPTGKPNDEAQNPMDAVLASPTGREIFAMHCSIDQVSNVLPRFLYMERDEIMDEQRYVFSVAYANGQPDDIISLEGTSITSPEAFHKAMLNRTRGGTFDGDAKQLKILRDRWLNSRMLTVTALRYYDPAQLRELFCRCAGTEIEPAVKLAGYLGLRRSEICGLKWRCVDLDAKIVTVREVRTSVGGTFIEKKPKSYSSVRRLCYDGVSDLEKLLTRLHDEWERGQRERGTGFNPEGYVAVTEQGKPWDPNGLGRRVAAFVEENALPSISLHGLRHSFASVANSRSVPMFTISKALGHSSTSITSEVYTHLFDETVQDVVNVVAKAIGTRA